MKEQEAEGKKQQEERSNLTSTGEVTSSWLEGLPGELRAVESLSKFKDIGALARSYLEAEKALSSKVTVPREDSSDEEWQKFYQKLGLPEDKRYASARLPEDEQQLQLYEEMLYNAGVSKRQGQRLLEAFGKLSQEMQQKQIAELEKERQGNLEWLQKRYGDEFEGSISLLQAALSKFGSKELAQMVEDSGYSPALVDLLVKVGQTLKSDALISGDVAGKTSGKNALAEIKRLEDDSEFMVKLRSKNHPAHAEAVRQLEELYKQAYDASPHN